MADNPFQTLKERDVALRSIVASKTISDAEYALEFIIEHHLHALEKGE